MPYIKKKQREIVDTAIDELLQKISCLQNEGVQYDGVINYCITRIMKAFYGGSYQSLNAGVGVLECVKLELYRRVVAPYEDTKLRENGEVY